ncbi:MAG: GNAT family N-acetyltransferase [Christensenellaceae bacterium]
MINHKRMKLIFSDDEFEYYLFNPRVWQLYYPEKPGREEPSHRYRLTHKLHMIHYILNGGYNLLYVVKNDEVVSYIAFVKCNNGIVKNSNKNDYYTIFLYTYPEYRSQGIASKMANVMLHKSNLNFRHFYKTISKDNYSSIKVAEKSGFKCICDANKVGIFHQIIPVKDGNQFLYRYDGALK